jgi:hypothetical protein
MLDRGTLFTVRQELSFQVKNLETQLLLLFYPKSGAAALIQ